MPVKAWRLGPIANYILSHSQAHYNLDVLAWDYTQRYPNPDNDVASGLTDTSAIKDNPGADNDPNKVGNFSADVTVRGDITLEV